MEGLMNEKKDSGITEADRLVEIMSQQGEPADILIVDDVHANVFMMDNMLNDRYIVHSVESAAGMWKYLKHRDVRLILLDLMMPFENGFEILEKLKADDRLKKIPVIIVSAKDSRDDVIKVTMLGAVDYIAKPVDEKILLKKVVKVIGEGELRSR